MSNVVKNDVVKKAAYDKSVAKINNIDTSGFVLKTKYDSDKAKPEKEIPDTSKLVKKSDFNAKISELENKISSISGLVKTAVLTALENKIPSVKILVKKIDYDTKVSGMEKKITDHNHDKYIVSPEFNKITAENFVARLAQANLISKTDFDGKLSSLNRKINSNKLKHLHVENQLKKLKTFDSRYFRGKSHFEDDGT